jgi:quercetin dioxygenase-like cupin family protein
LIGRRIGCALTLACLGASEPPGPSDPALPSPLEAGWRGHKVCELLLENAEVRTLRCTFPPGIGHERHFHKPHWGYVMAGGTMQITSASGTVVRDLKTGASWWSDGVDWHEAVNMGPTTAIYLIVEPKSAAHLPDK